MAKLPSVRSSLVEAEAHKADPMFCAIRPLASSLVREASLDQPRPASGALTFSRSAISCCRLRWINASFSEALSGHCSPTHRNCSTARSQIARIRRAEASVSSAQRRPPLPPAVAEDPASETFRGRGMDRRRRSCAKAPRSSDLVLPLRASTSSTTQHPALAKSASSHRLDRGRRRRCR